MNNTSSISETAATYGTAVADLQQPLILQQEGQPLAVMVSFEEYQHWRALAADEAQRRLAGWRSLDVLLEAVHQRPSEYTAEQIEVEIGLAQVEVRKARHDRRSGHSFRVYSKLVGSLVIASRCGEAIFLAHQRDCFAEPRNDVVNSF